METAVVGINGLGAVQRALEVLNTGGLVAFPTDTVYGLAARAFDPRGIERLYEVKGREAAKAIPILLGDVDHLPQVTLELTPSAQRLAGHYWPGALTLVVPKHPNLPEVLSPLPTVGVRMPDHPFTLALLRASGPLAVTSANLSGGPNPRSAQDVLAQLGGLIELLLDGGVSPGGVPSTVVDCTGAQVKILRQGAISAEEILRITFEE